MAILKAQIRDLSVKVKKLRKNSKIPSVVYGKDFGPFYLSIDEKEFKSFLKTIELSDIFDIEIEGKGKEKVLIREIQRDPVSDKIIHIDFHRIRMDEEIETSIKLHFIGESPAKSKGGVVLIQKEFLKVKCFPKYLVPYIEVNLSNLKEIGDILYVKDLNIPEGIKALELEDDVVVSVVKEEEEKIEEEERTVEEVEVVEKGKKEEEKSEEKGEEKPEEKE